MNTKMKVLSVSIDKVEDSVKQVKDDSKKMVEKMTEVRSKVDDLHSENLQIKEMLKHIMTTLAPAPIR